MKFESVALGQMVAKCKNNIVIMQLLHKICKKLFNAVTHGNDLTIYPANDDCIPKVLDRADLDCKEHKNIYTIFGYQKLNMSSKICEREATFANPYSIQDFFYNITLYIKQAFSLNCVNDDNIMNHTNTVIINKTEIDSTKSDFDIFTFPAYQGFSSLYTDYDYNTEQVYVQKNDNGFSSIIYNTSGSLNLWFIVPVTFVMMLWGIFLVGCFIKYKFYTEQPEDIQVGVNLQEIKHDSLELLATNNTCHRIDDLSISIPD